MATDFPSGSLVAFWSASVSRLVFEQSSDRACMTEQSKLRREQLTFELEGSTVQKWWFRIRSRNGHFCTTVFNASFIFVQILDRPPFPGVWQYCSQVYCTVVYCTELLCCAAQSYTVSGYTAPNYFVLCCTAHGYIVLCCTALSYNVLCCTAQN